MGAHGQVRTRVHRRPVPDYVIVDELQVEHWQRRREGPVLAFVEADTAVDAGLVSAGAGWPSRLAPLGWSRRFYPMLRIGAPRLEPASSQIQTLLIAKQKRAPLRGTLICLVAGA